MHFATAMRFSYRYIDEKNLDVDAPKDLVEAIKHGEGMKICRGKLYYVDRNANKRNCVEQYCRRNKAMVDSL